jgi:hypothetical protein
VRVKLLGVECPDVIHSCNDSNHLSTLTPSPIVNTNELIGRTFRMDEKPDGQIICACIVKMIDYHDYKLENNKRPN